MKIMPVMMNSQYMSRNFKASNLETEMAPPSINNNNRGCLGGFPYWMLLAYAIATSSPVEKFADKMSGQEDAKNEIENIIQSKKQDFKECLDLADEFKKVNGLSVAHHPLRTLTEIDNAEFSKTASGLNLITFKTDDKIISFSAKPDSKDKTKMTGEFVTADLNNPNELFRYTYKAHLSKDNSAIVKVDYKNSVEDEKTESVILKRENDGSLYVIKDGKKTKINSKNVEYHKQISEKYQELAEKEGKKPNHTFLYIVLLLMTFDKMLTPKRNQDN